MRQSHTHFEYTYNVCCMYIFYFYWPGDVCLCMYKHPQTRLDRRSNDDRGTPHYQTQTKQNKKTAHHYVNPDQESSVETNERQKEKAPRMYISNDKNKFWKYTYNVIMQY